MTLRNILVILTIILFFVFIFFIFFYKKFSISTSPNNPSDYQGSSTTISTNPNPTSTVPTGDFLVLQTERGGVQVKNFYKTAETVRDVSVTIKSTPRYEIQYFQADSSFSIVSNALNLSDLAILQKEFEPQFLDLLGVSKEDACKLDVTVGTVRSENPDLDGRRFSLSFCETH